MIRFHTAFGILVWVLFAAAWQPYLYEPKWIKVLLLFSPLVLMPLSRPLRPRTAGERGRELFEVPSAALLAPALAYEPGGFAALASLPWLIYCGVTALDVMGNWRQTRSRDVTQICLESSRVFPAIGAAWLSADRLGWNPFGFDSLIVLLTAAHFHHAGFTLPLIAGLQGQSRPRWLPRLACPLILVGIPLVAVGITLTHLAAWVAIEPWAVGVLGGGGLLVALLQLVRAFDPALSRLMSLVMGISGLSLAGAMLLALGYGLRFRWAGIALSMPSMWAIHGTLNVFGFGLAGIVSWRALIARKAEN